MSQTRQIRRAALKLVPPTTPAEPRPSKSSHIAHDARGTAVWVGEPAALDNLSALTLAVEPSATRALDGDPYNRPASGFGSRAATPFKASPAKRRR
jgi:hypothetical protein